MTDMVPLLGFRALAQTEADAQFVIRLTVFPAAFNIEAAAAVSKIEVNEARGALNRAVSRRLVHVVTATPHARLWALDPDLRARWLNALPAPELIAQAKMAHTEYFLTELARTAEEFTQGGTIDHDYHQFRRANLEPAACRRIFQIVGAPAESEPPLDLTRRQ
jgi:hypothetical protein